MGLRLPDRFLWDFWTITHGGTHHLYALSAPRHADPETRHDAAQVEHATSTDWRSWTHHGPALEPGRPSAWDDMTIWTGSVAAVPPERGGGFAMLYTGRCRAENGRVQRVGLALSDDLYAWRKHPDPVIEADPALYRTCDAAGECHWRDPWLEWRGGQWHAWITAQRPEGDAMLSGTVAHATSDDLVRWTVHPPVTDEGLAEHLEVPQVLGVANGRERMLASTYAKHVPAASPLPRACLSMLFERVGNEPFRFTRAVEAWPTDARYMVRRVAPGVGLCWLGMQADGTFLGEIGEPFALDV